MTFYTLIIIFVLIYAFQIYFLPKIAQSVKARRVTFSVSQTLNLEKLDVQDDLPQLLKIVKNQETTIKHKINV